MKKIFRRYFSCLLVLAILICSLQMGAFEAQGATSGIYTYSVTGGQATITACNDELAVGSITIPSVLDGYAVVAIGANAFQWCDGITEIIIGDNIKTLSEYAFYWCGGLKTVTIGDSITAINAATFMYCSSLENVKFGKNIKTIAADAFAHCKMLNNVIFPDSLETIGSYAFNRCIKLSNITIGAGLKNISNNAFYYCELLTNITIPRNVTSIGNGVFSGCTDLVIHCYRDSAAHSYAVAKGLKFELIVSLVGIEITAMPTKLIYVVGDAIDLSGIKITANYDDGTNVLVTNYQVSGFSSASAGITAVTITYLGKTAVFNLTITDFNYILINNYTQIEITGYKGPGGSVVIPSQIDGRSVTSIGENAFFNCNNITAVTIPDSVTAIKENAFKNCTGISQIDISANVAVLSKTAFAGCTSLTGINVNAQNAEYSSLDGVLLNKPGTQILLFPAMKNAPDYTLPSSVTSIGSNAFSDCTFLKNLTVNYLVTDIQANAIVACPNVKIICYEKSAVHNYAVTNRINFSFSATVNGIEIVSLPTKLTYLVGEGLLSNGMVVKAGYTDGTKVEIKDYTVSELNATRVGVKPITVSFAGYTKSFDVNVVEAESTVFQYSLIKGGTQAQITGYTGSGGDISVPLTIDSYPVTAIGPHAFERHASISSITIHNKIESIGESAFAYCNNIKTINIPDSVMSVGNNAFYSCTGLTQVIGMNSVVSVGDSAFYYCNQLTAVTLANTVASIGTNAFYNCAKLQTMNIGSGVSSIGDSAFWGCGVLEKIVVSPLNSSYSDIDGVLYNKGKTTLIYYPSGKTETSYIIGSNVKSISGYAFYNLSVLKFITIPKNVSIINPNAIDSCPGITVYCVRNSEAHSFAVNKKIKYVLLESAALVSISISSLPSKTRYIVNESLDLTGITVIANYNDNTSETVSNYSVSAFDSSTVGEKQITISYGLCTAAFNVTVAEAEKIPVFTYELIANTSKVKITGYTGVGGIVTIPAIIDGHEVSSIAKNAFLRNSNITELIISHGIQEIEEDAFLNCTALEKVTISGSVQTIGSDAFFQCTKLKKVVLGNGIKNIGIYAFSECTSLERLAIPESIASIGSSAFAGCTNLTNIILPDTVTQIDAYTFLNCTNLTTALLGSNIKSVGYNSFANCTKLKVYCYENTFIHKYVSSNAINFALVSACGDYIISPLNATQAQMVRYIGSNLNVVVPTQIGGYTIVAITGYAFSNCANLVSVKIQEGIKNIGAGAFLDCKALTGVTLPNSVARFEGTRVFDKTPSFKIYCNQNTAAHQYAQDCGIEYVLLDVRNYVGLTVSVMPSKTEYLIGEKLDLTGMVVVADYSNQTHETITDYTVSGFNSDTVGERIITVAYNGKQTTLSVNVSAPTFNYSFVTQTTIAITGYNAAGKVVYIPQTIDGYTVVKIANKAFENKKDITAVVIPNTVTSIGDNAFYDCQALNTLTIGQNVTSIGTWAFYNCLSLVNVTIPDKVKSIGGYAFYRCVGLKTLNLGDSVESIGYSAFRECLKIEAVNVKSNNQNFVSVEGILFNYSKTELICYTSGSSKTSYTIPYSVTSISSYAFNTCQYLNTLVIAKSTNKISANAIDNCVNMSIHCFAGSAAHTYAVKNSLLFKLEDNNKLSLMTGESTLSIDPKTNYLTGIDYANKTVADVCSKFNNVNVRIVDKKNQILSNDKVVGTDCKLQLVDSNANVLQEVTIIIFGDVDSDGSYDGNDALFVRLNALGKITLTAVQLKAADVNRDGAVNEDDAVKLELSGLFLYSVSQI